MAGCCGSHLDPQAPQPGHTEHVLPLPESPWMALEGALKCVLPTTPCCDHLVKNWQVTVSLTVSDTVPSATSFLCAVL